VLFRSLHRPYIFTETCTATTLMAPRFGGGKVVYLFIAIGFLTISSIGILSNFGQNGQQTLPNQSNKTQATYSVHSTPLLNLNYLNASIARQYEIHGLLVVGSALSSGQSLTAVRGQTIQVTIKLTWISYDSTISSVAVTFRPQAGQYVVGSIDVSSRETFTPSSVNVSAAQPVIVILSFQVPTNVNPITFRLLPSGVSTSPSVAVLIENDVVVTVQ